MSEQNVMQPLTAHIRALVAQRHFSEAEDEAAQAMTAAPHDAQPHNLMGIIAESRNDHVQAMKHFRAAWALDPTYRPARINMERYGSFSGQMPRPVYDETECAPCPAQMLMYGKVSQENYVELTAASAIPNKEIKSPQILRY